MHKEKIIFFIVGLIFVSANIFGTVLEQTSLKSLNQDDFIINKGESVCREYSFNLEKISDVKSSAYLQFNIKNYIPTTEGVEINFALNNQEKIIIKNKEILQNNVVELNTKEKFNNIEICVENNFLPRIIIDTEKSNVGTYYVSKITKNDFYQEAPSKAYVNTMIPIKLFLRNSGHAEAYVEIINATETFIYNSNLENVSGETSFKGTVQPQETITLNYFVKTSLNISFATPLAKLRYIDSFGQEHIMFLDTQIINLEEKDTKISAQIDVFRKIEPNKEYTGNLIIINNSEDVIKDLYITPNFNGEISLQKERISQINPKDVVEISFKIKVFKEEKNNSLNFNINYLDKGEEKNVGTQIVTLSSENKDTSQNTAITILIILTIILFIWIVKI